MGHYSALLHSKLKYDLLKSNAIHHVSGLKIRTRGNGPYPKGYPQIK